MQFDCGSRALEVFDVHGTPMSEIHKAQRIESPSSVGELRYPNTCVLWVQSEQSGKTRDKDESTERDIFLWIDFQLNIMMVSHKNQILISIHM